MQRLFRLKEYKKGCDLYNEMMEKGVEPETVAIMAMVAGHVGQNHISEAWKVFNSIEERGIRPTWKAYLVFIKELGKVGRTDEIFRVLFEMKEAKIGIRDEIFCLVVSCMERSRETDNVEKVKQMRKRLKLYISLTSHSLSNAFNKQDMEEVHRILSSSKDWTN